MSWEALKWALLKRLPAPQKSTLIALARRHPLLDLSLETLAGEAGLSRSGVKLAIAKLRAAQLLDVESRVNKANRFTLILDCASHDVTGYEVTGYDVPTNESPRDCLGGHQVTTNKQRDKNRKTDIKTIPVTTSVFLLPSWISAESWEAYSGMRRKKKAPMTDLARDLIISRLDRFRQAGHNPDEILNTSTRSNWTDIYEPKSSGVSAHGSSQQRPSQNAAAERQRISRDAISEAVASRLGLSPRSDDGPDAELFPQSDFAAGDAGSLAAGMGGIGSEVRTGQFHGRIVEGRQ